MAKKRFLDGFESGSADLWDAITAGGSTGVVLTSSLGGIQETIDPSVYCFFLDAASDLTKNIAIEDTSYSMLYSAFSYHVTALTAGTIICQWYRDATYLGRLEIDGSGHVVYRDDVGTVLGTSTLAITSTRIHHFVVRYEYGGKGLYVWIDGVQFLRATKSMSNTYANKWIIGSSANAATSYFDDVILTDDNTFDNDQREMPWFILALQVDANGAQGQAWTASTGTNWHCVDEVPANDADYVETNTAAAADWFSLEDLSVDRLYKVNASPDDSLSRARTSIQFQVRATRVDPSAVTKIRLKWYYNATTYQATATCSIGLSVDGYYFDCSEHPNPADANSWWDPALVNTMEMGIVAEA